MSIILGSLHNPHASQREILWFETQGLTCLKHAAGVCCVSYNVRGGGGQGAAVYNIERFIESFALQPADLWNLDLVKNSGRYDVTS